MHQLEINLVFIVNCFFKVGISAQIIIYIRNLGIELLLPFWLQSGILLFISSSRFVWSSVKIQPLCYCNTVHYPVLKQLFSVPSLSQKLEAHLPKTREVREAPHSCLCPPGELQSTQSSSPCFSRCVLFYGFTHQHQTLTPCIWPFKQAPFTLNCTHSRMSRLNMPLSKVVFKIKLLVFF